MSRIDVIKVPNPVLTRKADPVLKIDSTIKKLALDMAETMKLEKGVGLAAPQVNKSLRLFVISHKDGPLTVINPEISWFSKATDIEEEGCLSIPGVYVPVRRSTKIKLNYTDLEGSNLEAEAEGFLARVIQHEYDHINGVLITSRTLEVNS